MDPAEHRFVAALRKIESLKKAPLLEVLMTLEDLVEQRRQDAKGGQNEDGVAEREAEITKRAIQAEELLTQYVVALDALPVSGHPELRQRRKEIIGEAVAYGARISQCVAQRITTEAHTT